MPNNSDLPFQLLTHKLAMLMALANANRYSELAALDLSNGVMFTIPILTKSRRSGPPIQVFYPALTSDPKLCPVQTLRAYEERSRALHQHNRSNLLISVRKLHRPVKAITIGHWLKGVIKSAGIDTDVYSAHST